MGVEEANKRIYATTDRAKGTLKQLADAQGWPTFVVPDMWAAATPFSPLWACCPSLPPGSASTS